MLFSLAAMSVLAGNTNDIHFDIMAPGRWDYDPIYQAAADSLFYGTGKYEFSLEQPMTQGMFVTVLGRMAKINPGAYGRTSFADMHESTCYAKYITRAPEKKIVAGIGG